MMKKRMIFILSCLLLTCSGCNNNTADNNTTEQSTDTTQNEHETYIVESKNDIFTSDFFTGVEKVTANPFLGKNTITEREEMSKIFQLFASLEFTEVGSEEDYPELAGHAWLVLHCDDGKEKGISFTSTYLYMNDMVYTLVPEQSDALFTELYHIFGGNPD